LLAGIPRSLQETDRYDRGQLFCHPTLYVLPPLLQVFLEAESAVAAGSEVVFVTVVFVAVVSVADVVEPQASGTASLLFRPSDHFFYCKKPFEKSFPYIFLMFYQT